MRNFRPASVKWDPGFKNQNKQSLVGVMFTGWDGCDRCDLDTMKADSRRSLLRGQPSYTERLCLKQPSSNKKSDETSVTGASSLPPRNLRVHHQHTGMER